MPTRMGGYLNGLIFLMFLLAVGYNNNLLLIFTLFLFGLNLIWVIQTHFHLHRLRLHSVHIDDGHAGDFQHVHIHWLKTPEGPHRWDMTLENDEVLIPVKSLLHDETHSEGNAIIPRRGLWKFQHLMIASEMPFGLYKAWIFYKVDAKAYVYPAKLKDAPPIERLPGLLEGEQSSLIKGPHDVRNLAPYQGDESRKISWKHYARSGELVIKEGEELTKSMVHFSLKNISSDKEFVLSKIATQMLFCTQTDTVFSLETLTKKTGPAASSGHLTECLRELATC